VEKRPVLGEFPQEADGAPIGLSESIASLSGMDVAPQKWEL